MDYWEGHCGKVDKKSHCGCKQGGVDIGIEYIMVIWSCREELHVAEIRVVVNEIAAWVVTVTDGHNTTHCIFKNMLQKLIYFLYKFAKL